jgi:hypothetical protein
MKIPNNLFLPTPEELAEILMMEEGGLINRHGAREIVRIISGRRFDVFLMHYEKLIRQNNDTEAIKRLEAYTNEKQMAVVSDAVG